MEIRALRYFLTVVREESITEAAEVLHITQPTLSRQLIQLEEGIGVKLFIKGTGKISLTSEGILLRRWTEEITVLVDKTEKELSVQEEQAEDCISTGYGELAVLKTLLELLKSSIQRYPRVALDLFAVNADQVKEHMEAGTIDTSLLLEPIGINKHESIRLGTEERWVTLMHPDDPLAEKEWIMAEDLAGLPIIMVRRARLQNELANQFGDHFKDLDVLFKSDFNTNDAIMAQSRLGYSLAMEGSALPWDKGKICCRPLCPEIISVCVLAWKRQQPFSRAAMKFIGYMKDSMATVGA